MRATFRSHGGVHAYWQARWEAVPADDGTLNLARYPGIYAQDIISRTGSPVLEAGCGAGRIVRHFHNLGHDIVGIDYIPDVLGKIQSVDSTAQLAGADILRLPFKDNTFASVLAFGLYHNLEVGLIDALNETRRIIKKNGLLCASFRADNIQNRLLDRIVAKQVPLSHVDPPGSVTSQFHKMNYRRKELETAFSQSGFIIESIRFVENMPFLYKFSALRASDCKMFDETTARAKGYRLSLGGRILQSSLMSISPAEFCNLYVIIAQPS